MNLYIIILILFTIAGLFICIREWRHIKNQKKSDQWLSIEGVIVESKPYNPVGSLLPVIKYSYQIEDSTFTNDFEFPPGTAAMPEFSKSYMEKYPEGKTINVFYNPEDANQSTLEPGQQKDDWLIFGIGVLTTITGIVFLVFGH